MSVIINPAAASAGGITQLTGDVAAGPGSGSQAATLASIITAGGPIGDSTHTPVITWDAKGRLTAVSSALISGGGGGMAIGGTVTGGTPGSVLFIGTGPVLAQDNANFFWDDTNFRLQIGHTGASSTAVFINSLPALFTIPAVAGASWFEDNAGNFTTTGHLNLGTGDGALGLLTTGFENTAMGAAALGSCTSGRSNVAIGANALANLTTAGSNFGIGTSSLLNSVTGDNNLAIGNFSLQRANGGGNVIAIGSSAFQNLTGTSSHDTIGIGTNVGNGWVSGANNTAIGPYAGFNVTSGSSNTLMGAWEGPSASLSHVIAITDGQAVATNSGIVQGLDYNYTVATTWSFQNLTNTIGLHVYNTTDGGAPPTNYERLCVDWNLTSNVARVASQAGGTGTVRIIAIDGFSKAGAPANTDLPSGTWALIDDTTNNQTWLVFNKAGTIRKVQLT